MSGNGIEIERKYLLAAPPDEATLRARGAVPLRIEQAYLSDPPSGRRVRRTVREDGSVDLRLTRKARLAGIARREDESPISEAEYEALLREADPDSRPIVKTRHLVEYGGHVLEIDVFDSPPGLALVEVELESVDEPVELPDWLDVVRDVSEDPAYLNANLARVGAPGAAR